MDPDRRRTRELADQASGLAPSEQAAFLEQASGGDDALRREVETLLKRAPEPGTPVDETVGNQAHRAVPPATPLTGHIGPYRILKILGEGGMGTVYLAEQREPIRRRVALKVIRRGAVAPQEVRRFEAERQALARMNHPNIAQVFEAGATGDGEPYLVMEYVPGLPITEYCDGERSSVRQRLELFIAVCEGVQHAHQKGIIHRDIKPSNVLVTESPDRDRPVVKVIDFGVAKALDQPLTDGTVFTGNRLIGTPAYWSPEIVRASSGGLDVDTRSDVYALGVLLYELLAGELPFAVEGQGLVRVLRVITEKEPESPSRRLASLSEKDRLATAHRRHSGPRALIAALAGDLDWICLKSMAKERSRRYGSVAGLAADVERHLCHLPVAAGPPSPAYRARKFVRRNRVWVAASILVVLALLGGFVARSLEARRANREAERANREAEASRQISEFLLELFEVSDPGAARGNSITAREILDRGAQRIRGELADQPLTRAQLLDTIGTVYSQLGLYEPAAPLLEEALELRREHLAGDDLKVASSLSNVGALYERQGRYEEAESLYRQARSRREKILGPEHPEVVQMLRTIATLYKSLGRYEEAEVGFRQALAISERVLGPDHIEVAKSLLGLATLNYVRGNYQEAEVLYRRALAIEEKALGTDHPDIATYLGNLANIYFQQARYEQAVSFYQRAVKIRERALGPDHPYLASDLVNLALVYQEQQRSGEAEAIYRRVLPALERALGPDHPRVAHCMTNLADLHRRQGRLDDAERLLLQALPRLEKVLGSEHYLVADALGGLAYLRRDQGRLDEAEAVFRRVLAIREKINRLGHPELQEMVRDYAALLRTMGRAEEAAALEDRFADLGEGASRGSAAGTPPGAP